jgi:four helix bundle protein
MSTSGVRDATFDIQDLTSPAMTSEELQERTRKSALATVKFVAALPKSKVADVLGRQLLRSATSVGANRREAVHAESRADFIHKMNVVEKEAAETACWLELCRDSSTGDSSTVDLLLVESRELTAIFAAACRTAKRRL